VTCNGGVGGAQAVSGTAVKAFAGGAGGAISTNGDLNITGETGQAGCTIEVATPLGFSGNGADGLMGAGGQSLIAVGTGNNATGYGAGGGGSMTGASTARTGGNGANGLIIVEEYT
jgi:hypothetical protein